MQIITGIGESEHVTSMQHRAIFEMVIGNDSYILNKGELLKPELQSNNALKIRSGMLAHHGCISEVAPNTYDEVAIGNGSQNMKRIDLVVARYTQNAETKVERTEWTVIQGQPVESNPVAPDYIHGNMQDGDLTDDCPVFEVHLDGIQVVEIKKLLNVLDGSLAELNRKLLPWDAWRQSFLGTHIYRLQFGDINGNIIQTNQLSIPWLPSEVTVALSKINIPGAGTIAIDYKSAYLTTEGGLYIYCSTAGAAGVASLKWQVVDATIVIQRK